jgi:hypothetical protein
MAIIAMVTLFRNGKKDTAEEAVQRATMTADIKYIRGSIDDIKLENRGMKKDIDDIKTRVVVVEKSVESAHQRLDDMAKG